jgi:hypothetical protein
MGFVSRTTQFVAVVLCLAFCLAGCGGGGGSGATGGGTGGGGAVVAGNFFPTTANSRWVYASTAASAPSVVTVAGTAQTSDGQTGAVFQTVDGADGSVAQDIYVVTGSSVQDYAPAGSDPISAALSGITVMSLPIQVGTQLSVVDKTLDSGADFDGDGKNDSIRVRATLTVVGVESVSTPAGVFPAALHQRQSIVETLLPSGGEASVDVDITIDDWYADGVGLVQSTTHVTATGLDDSSTVTLASYRVGPLKSDYTAPTVLSVTPGSGVVRGSSTSVSATFSKTIDAQTIKGGTFTVVDGNGAAIAGTTQLTGNTLQFVANQPWASGAYTARITTDVADDLGNALASDRVWTFTVDATGPGIVSVTPAAGALDVDVSPTIVVTFSEAPDPASVSAIQVTNGSFPVRSQYSIVGTQVSVTPLAQLDFDSTFTIDINGVTDLVGNPMAQAYTSQFQTVRGRFADPVSIYPFPGTGAGALAMAIGDVNGDGIADVLLSSDGALDPAQNGLFVLTGNADGTLAPAVKVDIGTQLTCSITSIAIGDVNGDGRPDVVVGGNFCGMQVLHQAANGSLVVAEFLNRAASGSIRIADLDGNGKKVLLAVGGGTSGIDIYRQDGSGTLTLSQSLPLVGFGVDVEVGDVNGDGVPDVVAAVSGSLGQDIAVFLRQGGNFAAPFYLSTDSVWQARAIAIGDLNGDGRQDIIAATGGNSPTYIAAYYQDSSGHLGAATHIASYDIPTSIRIVDIDGDGRADVVVSHNGFSKIGLYLQQADGVLAPEKLYPASSNESFLPGQMAVGDVNRDGRPDIVISGSLLLQLPNAPAAAAASRHGPRSGIAAAVERPIDALRALRP